MASDDVGRRTIEDFGVEWTRYPTAEGYFGSVDLLADFLEPLMSLEDIEGKRVCEIGTGAGRIVEMLLDAGAAHVVAVEPSQAYQVMLRNTADRSDRVTPLNITGDQLPPDSDLDIVVSLGVIHHIPEPVPVIEACYEALKPGGKILIWLYGHEGNELYLAIFKPLRVITQRLPHWLLYIISWMLWVPMYLYMQLCKVVRLPLREYLLKVMDKLTIPKQQYIIYDQLNPAYAKYYTRQEAHDLIADAGFEDVQIHHRHAYSWTVRGTKPAGVSAE